MCTPNRKSLVVQAMSVVVTFFTLATCTYLLLAQPDGLPRGITYWSMGLFSMTVGSWLPRRSFDRL